MKAITTKFFGGGNKKGSRIIAKDGDGNKVEFVCRDDCSAAENHRMAALKLCVKLNWLGLWHEGCLGPGEWVYVNAAHNKYGRSIIRWNGGHLADIGPAIYLNDDKPPRYNKADVRNL
jgi:hypothetical protein